MFVHGRANPLLVWRDEEIPIAWVIKRLIKAKTLIGICGRADPECCRSISFVIPVSLSLDPKCAARASSHIFDLNVGFGISKGHA
jgi:hypothetical protein